MGPILKPSKPVDQEERKPSPVKEKPRDTDTDETGDKKFVVDVSFYFVNYLQSWQRYYIYYSLNWLFVYWSEDFKGEKTRMILMFALNVYDVQGWDPCQRFVICERRQL